MKYIDKKWQKIWQEENAFITKNYSTKPKYYILEMLPYTSGKIHVGHLRNYSIGDVLARFMRSNGYNILHPIGWDSFGLPAENAAIHHSLHPKKWTNQNITTMKDQLKSIGLSYDWTKEIITCNPEYYKHQQKLFIELYNKGIAYRKKSLINWDPIDQTVLANEQVIDGKGWRSGALIEKKYLNQWFLKITNYSEELLQELSKLKNWPDSVKNMQSKWIGKSKGLTLNFKIQNHNEYIKIFLPIPETIFGATFIIINHNHPIVQKLIKKDIKSKFIKNNSKTYQFTKNFNPNQSINIKTNLSAINPFNENIILPIIITESVIDNYNTNTILGYPAHNIQDYKLAKQFKLPIIPIIYIPNNNLPLTKYPNTSLLINSYFLNNLCITDARSKIIAISQKQKIGKLTTKYKLQDWGISRQRFWGCPIPIIYCNTCGIIPDTEDNLPITLPEEFIFHKSGNPLDKHPTWKYTNCPKCHKQSQRETDTFDTFFESSWYFIRYCDTKAKTMTNIKACNYWLPVNQYIGGIEHAIMHLLYARFFTKIMNEQKYINIREPFINLLTQGMVLHTTYKDSNNNWLYPKEIQKIDNQWIDIKNKKPIFIGRAEKMSKSKKNIIDLDELLIDNSSVDTVRLFILSDSPPDKDFEWSFEGLNGCKKFINKLFNLLSIIIKNNNSLNTKINLNQKKYNKEFLKLIHNTIKYVTENIKDHKFNISIAKLRELFNAISIESQSQNCQINFGLLKYGFTILIRLLNPFIPHITEELWEILGNTKRLYNLKWPKFNIKILEEEYYIIKIQINNKLKDTHKFNKNTTKTEIKNTILQLNNIQKYLNNNSIKKIIIIDKKIINIIT